jgi:hypothetical protein
LLLLAHVSENIFGALAGRDALLSMRRMLYVAAQNLDN